MFWKCSCGEFSVEEDGTGKPYLNSLLNHMKKGGYSKGGHKCAGLFENEDDTEPIAKTINDARNKGYIESGGGKDEEEKESRTGSTDPMKTTVRGAASGTTTMTIKGAKIELPVWVWAYASMFMSRFTDSDGLPYAWDADGFAKFIVDFLRFNFQAMVGMLLELDGVRVDDAGTAAFIATVEGMNPEQLAGMIAREAAIQVKDPEKAEHFRKIARQLA